MSSHKGTEIHPYKQGRGLKMWPLVLKISPYSLTQNVHQDCLWLLTVQTAQAVTFAASTANNTDVNLH